MQQQGQLSWKDRRRQRRKWNIFGSAAFVIIISIIITATFSLIGTLSPTTGTAIIGSVALLLTFLTWRYPRPPALPTSAPSAGVDTVTLQNTGSIAIAPPVVTVPAISPFNALVRLLDPKNFYGRLSERSTLVEKTRQKASTSIVGPRRIGKTWLLQYLMLVAPTELGATYHLVDMSAQLADFNTLIDFVESVFQELKKQMQPGTIENTILEESLVALREEQAKAEPNILSVLERAMRNLSREGIVSVLCIDEFNSITNSPQRKRQFNLDFFRSLRGMADSQSTSLVLVIVSQDPLKKIVGRVGHESGFFNIFNHIRLGSFSLEEAEDFVQTKGDQAQFCDLERDYLLKLGGRGRWIWRKYWPVLLEQAGEVIWSHRAPVTGYHQPGERQYWKMVKRKVVERSVF